MTAWTHSLSRNLTVNRESPGCIDFLVLFTRTSGGGTSYTLVVHPLAAAEEQVLFEPGVRVRGLGRGAVCISINEQIRLSAECVEKRVLRFAVIIITRPSRSPTFQPLSNHPPTGRQRRTGNVNLFDSNIHHELFTTAC